MSYAAGDLVKLTAEGDPDQCIVVITGPSNQPMRMDWHGLVVESGAAWMPKGMVFTISEQQLDRQGIPAAAESLHDIARVVDLIEDLNEENEQLGEVIRQMVHGVTNPVKQYRRHCA